MTTKLTIRTDNYEASHGKKPRGTGSWAFHPVNSPDYIMWAPPRYSFTAAKRWLREEGHTGTWQVAA